MENWSKTCQIWNEVDSKHNYVYLRISYETFYVLTLTNMSKVPNLRFYLKFTMYSKSIPVEIMQGSRLSN